MKKKILFLICFLCLVCSAQAKVFLKVFLPDGTTPLPLADPQVPDVYNIMVGTRLTIFVSSDTGGLDCWTGCLLIEGDYMNNGILFGRGYDGLYPDSCLPAAGDCTLAYDWIDPNHSQGIDLYTDIPNFPGDWFVLDYNAINPGTCILNLYDHLDFSNPPGQLIASLKFNQISTCDFNGDSQINYIDFATLAAHWQQTSSDPNILKPADLNSDGHVDLIDLQLFSDVWLQKIN